MALALFRTESDQRINVLIRTNMQRFCLVRTVRYQAKGFSSPRNPTRAFLDIAGQRATGVEHVSTHATRRLVAVATRHDLQDLAVLFMRLDEAIALAELGAPERSQTGADADGLFHHELVVRRAIDRLVELAVE